MIVVNTLLLILIVSVLLAGLLQAWDHVRARRVYSALLDPDSYAEIPREVAIATGRELDEYGENQSFVFKPWTTFMVAPREGRFLNVDSGRTFNTRRGSSSYDTDTHAPCAAISMACGDDARGEMKPTT